MKTNYRNLALLNILIKKTDEDHPMPMSKIIDELNKQNICAERKAIYRDIKDLKDFGYDIIYTPNKGYFVGNKTFDLSEIKIIVDALSNTSFLSNKKTKQIIDKLCKDLSTAEKKLIQNHLIIQDKDASDTILYNIDTLIKAINDSKAIQFKYFDYTINKQKQYRKHAKNYELIPYNLIYNDNKYYLVGYNQKHDTFLNYRIDRMDHIESLNHVFKKPFDIEKYINTTFNMFSGTLDNVTLKCSNKLMNIIFEKFNNTIITEYNEQNFTINVNVQISPTFIGWLLQFKDQIKVLKPASLINLILSYTEDINKLYKE